jgi:glycosyltransferase involved in cell wall biosynthesis
MAGRPSGEVLFVTSSYPRWPGDATTPFVHHLAQDLRALGWDVHVLAPHAPGAAREETLDGVPVRRFRYLWPASLETVCYDGGALAKLRANRWLILRVPFLVLAQWLVVTRHLLRRRVALVHAHWLLPQGLTASLAAAMLGSRRLVTAHGSDVFALRGALSRYCKRLALRLADTVTVNSTATAAAVAALAPDACRVERIPMGATGAAVSASRDRSGALDGPVLVFVGRLVPDKGVADLLRAVRRLRERFPGAVAHVIGDGPERASLEREARELGIAGCVHFLGWLSQDEVQRQLRSADIFVGPSRPGEDGTLEGQGLALAEAMLAGIPVVATAVGGIPDAIRDEETGLLVPPGRPDAIAQAVCRLLDDRELAGRLAGSARALAQAEFTRAVSAERFSALYTRLLSAPGGAGSREKT